ncbi:hypothetical protein [Kribbella sp. NPDC048928]|uniref:hypothetical protein n=1 Tax=Kribbella sp. NPDC048928 TaxID=3364111 RepID=UPI00371C5B42
MSQPAGPLFTPGSRKAAIKFLTNLTPDQQRNFEKMLNHQPRMKRMWNATMNTAQEAWNSQPGLQARYVGNQVAAATGAAVRGAQFAAQNPRQAWDNTVDAGGQALAATGRGLETGLRATGRGIETGVKATGRGIGQTAAAAGRGIANSAVGQGVANTTRGVASDIANSKFGRWVSDKWSRSTVAAEAGFRAFKEGRANPAAPQVSAPDGADLSARATAVVAAQSPAEQLAAAEQVVAKLRSQIEQSNTTGMQAAQAPAAQATQSTGAQTPGAAGQQGTDQSAQQGAQQRPAQPAERQNGNGGVQR